MEEKITIWIVTVEYDGSDVKFAESHPFRTKQEAVDCAKKYSDDFVNDYGEGCCTVDVQDDGIYTFTDDYFVLSKYEKYQI